MLAPGPSAPPSFDPLAESVASSDLTEDTPRPSASDRLTSLLEVLLCQGLPTQLVLMIPLALAGLQPRRPDGTLSLAFITLLSLADAILVLALVVFFLRRRGEAPRHVLLGHARWRREVSLGVLLIPLVFVLLGLTAVAIQRLAPWLRNVPENPLASLLRGPLDLAIMLVVVVVAGGVREEVQRGFALHRFERHLGGRMLGLVVFNVAFGLGHALQGWDAAVYTSLLGLVWGLVYLERRSIVAATVCHSAFNVIEITYFWFSR